MHGENFYRPHTVLSKTEKGQMMSRQFASSLTPRQRRVLLVIDQSTPLESVMDNVPSNELSDTVSFLIEEGLIALENQMPRITRPKAGSGASKRDAGAEGMGIAGKYGNSKRISRAYAKRAAMARLKNPEIFTPQSRGGFGSAALVAHASADKDVGNWVLFMK